MRMFSSYPSPKVNLFSGNTAEFSDWAEALRTAGLRVLSPKKNYSAYDLEKELVVILDPSDTITAQQFIKQNQRCLHNLYIISNKPFWKELNAQYPFNLLTMDTHPLEAARLVIHSAKASKRPQNYFARYASLFNF